MKLHLILAAPLLALAVASAAAQPQKRFMDHSNARLIDEATALAVMDANIPERVWKIYPSRSYIFTSQVEGGITPAGTCVVAARVILLPLTGAAKAVLFRPQKTATAFDAVPNAGLDQCQALARDKLKEATLAVVSAIVKS
ncbi:MAG TPA: hypothetical protein VLM87_08670 [Rubrivivax sp.]|nr:hypothetical protein [Rubrivivax sp.]